MKKLTWVLLAFLIFSCQEIIDLERPEDYQVYMEGNYWERAFEGFWTGMNNNYAFWDIDPTDWDKVYRDYKPRFAALGPDDTFETMQKARTYFTEITKDLTDGHFSLRLAGDDSPPIAPAFGRYFEQRGADYYDNSTWENSGILQSELIEGDFMELFPEDLLFNALQNYTRPGTGSFSATPDGFKALIAKIALDNDVGDDAGDSILYFRFTSFAWYNTLNNMSPDFELYRLEMENIWNSFIDNLHAPDIKGIIIDLRANGGGAAVDLPFIWGKMFSKEKHQIGYAKTKMGDGRLDFSPLTPFYLKGDPDVSDDVKVPIVLLVNKFSISCSEISALFIRSLPNGFIVGGTTFGGQGPLYDNQYFNGGQFSSFGIEAVMTASLQTLDMNKQSFEGKGIEPDYLVPFDYDKFVQGIDTRLEKAIEVVRENQ